MKYIILLGLITITLATITIDTSMHCVYSEIKSQSDCSMYGGIWSSNSCQQRACSSYFYEDECKLRNFYSNVICKWENSNCKDYTPICSDFKTQIDCDYDYPTTNCAWKDSCQPFTKCSDYMPGQFGCIEKSSSTQKCQMSGDGSACENYTTKSCSRFTNSSLCIFNSQSSFCFWDGACYDFTNCSQIKNINQCTYNYSESCTYDSTICRNKLCSDYTNLQACNYVTLVSSTIKIICHWDSQTSKCFEPTDVSALNQPTCFPETNYNFTWDGIKCTRCTGVEVPSSESNSSQTSSNSPGTSPGSSTSSETNQSNSSSESSQTNSPSSESSQTNSPSSESSQTNSPSSESSQTNSPGSESSQTNSTDSQTNQSNTNSGSISSESSSQNSDTNASNSQSNQDSNSSSESTTNQNPQTYATPFIATKVCACPEILSQTDCNASKICVWKTSCEVNVCFIRATQFECEIQGHCIWTGIECIFFTKCAHYKVTVSTQCSLFGPCTASTEANKDGTYYCVDAPPITCSAFTSSDTCFGKQADHKECVWVNKSCVAYDLSICGGILDQNTCIAKNCKWGTACTVQTCADQTTSTTCTLVRGDPLPAVQICQWNAQKLGCSNHVNATLTSANCASTTGFRSRWNHLSNKCEDCTGIAFTMVLGITLGIIGFAL